MIQFKYKHMSLKLTAIQFKNDFEKEIHRMNDNIWNSDSLSVVAMRGYEDHASLQCLLNHERMTRKVRNVIQNTIKTKLHQILMIYWNEFKKVRSLFRNIYYKTVKQYEENRLKIMNLIYTKIELNPSFEFESTGKQNSDTSIVESYEKIIDKFAPNETSLCHICFDNTINRVLTHSDGRACCICDSCESKLTSLKCPFCNLEYASVLRISL